MDTSDVRLRKCSVCGEEKPASPEYFRRDSSKKDGLVSQCKTCRNRKEKQYRDMPKNKERIKSHTIKRDSRYLHYQEEYRKAHKDYFKKYFRTHKDKMNIYLSKRMAMKKKLQASLTFEQWENAKEYFLNKCAYCGKEKPLAQEHFIPVSKGGEYSHNNIVPACKTCNSSKRDHDFFKWYPNFKYYSKPREREILNYLGYKKGIQQLSLL